MKSPSIFIIFIRMLYILMGFCNISIHDCVWNIHNQIMPSSYLLPSWVITILMLSESSCISKYDRKHGVFDFLCLAYFTQHTTFSSIHFATNDRISFFRYEKNVFPYKSTFWMVFYGQFHMTCRNLCGMPILLPIDIYPDMR